LRRLSGCYFPFPLLVDFTLVRAFRSPNALSLGATSSGEIVDFELTKVMDLETFKQQLRAQLPADLPVYQVEEIPLNAPACHPFVGKSRVFAHF
jgi:uncharacterized protein (DUF2344 family)